MYSERRGDTHCCGTNPVATFIALGIVSAIRRTIFGWVENYETRFVRGHLLSNAGFVAFVCHYDRFGVLNWFWIE